MTNWELPTLELLVGWNAFGREMLPTPLRYLGDAGSHDEYQQQYREAANHFAKHWDEQLYRAFVTLAQPWARIELVGYRTGEPDPVIRVHGAVAARSGAVLVQRRDRDTVHIARTSVEQVARHVVGRLPAMPAGPQPRLEVAMADLAPPSAATFARPESWAEPEKSPAETLRQRTKDRLGGGHITIIPGPDLSELPVSGTEFVWFDLPDGRYLQWHDHRILTLFPVDEQRFAQHLQHETTRTADRYRREVSS
ncbi:MAG: ESX secretion-associated protein EspG [Mycobacteriaceae bacterium]|nr:ESX secretion-associated protein EspG [Mycobacteriaceae bacterium]